MTSYLKIFTNLMNQFLLELTEIFPDEKNLQTYYFSVTSINKVNPRMSLDYFKYYVMPFKSLIEERNEKYFIDEEYQENVGLSENSIVHGTRLKELWKVMSEDTKEKVWQYFENLIKIIEMEEKSKKKN